jgi:cysteine desulfurase
MKVYLDNAATTQIDPMVLEAMLPYFKDHYGNPSSIHSFGRDTRSAIEKSRKKVAELLGTSPAHIFFTSGGTEADNCAIINTISQKQIKQAITSPLEHHAVLHSLEHLAKNNRVDLKILEVDQKGNINLDQLRKWVEKEPSTFVSLMEGNNEIGNLNPVFDLANEFVPAGVVFHSDTVQTVGHFKHNLSEWKTNFIVGSAHKFHGPKGIGFLYISPEVKINPLIHGGSQERNMRGGTENVYGIVGLAKALELAVSGMESHRNHILSLKSRMISKLRESIQGVSFNGNSDSLDQSLYTVLNVSLPPSDMNEMLLFNLDINQIAASGGSACSSGSEIGSHVLKAIGASSDKGAVRFSFCKYNTENDIDKAVEVLSGMYAGKSVTA